MKREASNVKAMHEALIQCELFLGNVSRHGHPTLNPGDKCTACDGVDELRGMVVAALSTPPRNCDRYATVDEAKAEWLRTNAKLLSSTGLMPFESWLFAPVEECAE